MLNLHLSYISALQCVSDMSWLISYGKMLFSRLEVYPKPWRMAFLEAQGQMIDKLYAFNPVTQKTLSLWEDHYK